MNGFRSRFGSFAMSPWRVVTAAALVASSVAVVNPPSAGAVSLNYRIDLKVLVLDDNSVEVNAMQSQMDAEGLPYTSVAVPTSGQLAAAGFLASGNEAKFQAVVAPDYILSNVAPADVTALRNYEAKFGIREVDMYNYPGFDFGLGAPVVVSDFTGVTATINATGKASGWGYLNGPVLFSVGSAGYLAQPVAGGKFTSVLDATVGSPGSVMGIYADSGREHLILSATLSYTLPQFKYLAHGIITWMTRGVHFGYDRLNFTVHFDDAFARDSLWDPTPGVHCTPDEDCPAGVGTPRTARMSATDVAYAAAWTAANNYEFTLAFNGFYVNNDTPDPAANAAFVAHKDAFQWLNHGYQHTYQGCVQNKPPTPWVCALDGNNQLVETALPDILTEIDQNIAVGQSLGLTFDVDEYLSGEHSGLAFVNAAVPGQNQPDNPNFLTAMNNRAMVAIGSDASRETGSRLIGIATSTIPRHPTALYYNAATRTDAVSEYNWFYTTAADGGSGTCGVDANVLPCIHPLLSDSDFDNYIVPTDVAYNLGFILSNDPRPLYAHTTNLTGGANALAYPWLNLILGTLKAVFAPSSGVVNLTLTESASQLVHQQQWSGNSPSGSVAGDITKVAGYVQNGSITISNSSGRAVPFTAPAGTNIVGNTLQPYAGESSAWLSAAPTYSGALPSAPGLYVSGNVFVVGQSGTLQLSTSTIPAASVWPVVASLPTWLSYVPTVGGGKLTGTPPVGTEGTSFPISIDVISGGYNNRETVTLTIARKATISSAAAATAVAGKPFTFNVTTASGIPMPTIAVTSGSLPSGITLTDNANGTATLAGTPALSTGGQTFPVTLTATTPAGATNQNFTLTVNTVPAFTSPATASAVVDQSFSFTVTTSGIPAPAITKSGALPFGITFTDIGNGTATLAGTAVVGELGNSFPITLTATSSSGVVQQVLTINVAASASLSSIAPARLADTRPGYTTVDGQFAGIGQRQIGSTLQLLVAGRGGVPADAIAVALNVTSAEATGAGYVTVFPCGDMQPTASNLNYTAGSVVPNAVIAKLGTDGQVCLFTSNATQLIVDVNGYFPAGSTFHPMNPARFLETRANLPTVDGQQQGDGMRGQNTVTTLHVGGRAGVPAGIAAVVLNVTVTEAQGPGFVTVYPCGQIPTASNINYAAGSTVANMAVAKVDANGNVCLYNNEATQLVVDVNGYFPNDGSYQAMDPARLLETRPNLTTIDQSFNGGGLLANGTITQLTVAGRGGVPANAKTVVLNVTVTEPTLAGFITVYPCGIDTPLASNLNYTAGATVAIAVIAQVPSNGKVCLFNSAATQLIADVNGYLLD